MEVDMEQEEVMGGRGKFIQHQESFDLPLHDMINELTKRVNWIGWLFNVISTQKGQFVPTAAEGNRLSRLRTANKIQSYNAYYLTLHDNNVIQLTVKQS